MSFVHAAQRPPRLKFFEYTLIVLTVIAAHLFFVLFRPQSTVKTRKPSAERYNAVLSDAESRMIAEDASFILADPSVFIHGPDEISFGYFRKDTPEYEKAAPAFAAESTPEEPSDLANEPSDFVPRGLSELSGMAIELKKNDKDVFSPSVTYPSYPLYIYPASLSESHPAIAYSDESAATVNSAVPLVDTVFKVNPARKGETSVMDIFLESSCGVPSLDLEARGNIQSFLSRLRGSFSPSAPFRVYVIWRHRAAPTADSLKGID